MSSTFFLNNPFLIKALTTMNVRRMKSVIIMLVVGPKTMAVSMAEVRTKKWTEDDKCFNLLRSDIFRIDFLRFEILTLVEP